MPTRPPARRLFLALAALLIGARGQSTSAFADELLPADRDVSEVIDHYIGAALEGAGVTPAPGIDDRLFIRRATLDLAGRIPTAAEVQAFLESPEPDKRARLVDDLLASPDYAFHHANWFDAMLLGGERVEKDWLTYLRAAAAEDYRWDEMFRQMMVGEADTEPQRHALTYLKRRADSADDMTNDTSRLFFGVSINCAQCHDHPLVDDWKQDHYFGFKRFFDRTFLTRGDRLAEKYGGEVKFKTVGGVEKTAAFMFLTGAVVEEPPREKSKEELKKEDELIKQAMKEKDAPHPPAPEFSPRAELVKLALTPENAPMLARAMVNRTWARFLGYGIVHPLDQIHSANPPSHPELLDWLTRDFQQHEFRLKRLIRGIVLSEAYARGSEWTGDKEKRPYPYLFAVAQTRVLTPRQYGLSLIVASSSPSQFSPAAKPEDWPARRESLENQSHGLAGQLEWPTEHFQVSVDEALLFSNSERVQNDYLRDSNDKLVGHLKTIEDPAETIRVAFRNVLSREPDESELSAFSAFIESRADRPADALRQIVWALLTSPEMRFNY
jgi:hypothetical protein